MIQRLILPARLAEAARLTAWMEEACTALSLPHATRFAVELCAEELFVNAVMHGGATQVMLALEPGPVLLMEDDGGPFDPRAEPNPGAASLDNAREGGRGLLLVKRFAAALDYARTDGRNRMTVRIAPPG